MLDKLESNILAMKNIVDMARNDGREDLSSLIPLAERVIELAAQQSCALDATLAGVADVKGYLGFAPVTPNGAIVKRGVSASRKEKYVC